MRTAFVDLLYQERSVLAAAGLLSQIRWNLVTFSFTDSAKEADKFSLSFNGVQADVADKIEVAEDDPVTVVFGQGDWLIQRKMRLDKIQYSYGTTVGVSFIGRADELSGLSERGGAVWVGKTDSEIVTDIARLTGLTANVTPTTIVRPHFAQGNRTYMQILSHLGEENDFVCKPIDGAIIFAPRDDKSPPGVTLYRGTGKAPVLEDFSISSKRTSVKPGARVQGKGKDKGAGTETSEVTSKEEETLGWWHFNDDKTNEEVASPEPGVAVAAGVPPTAASSSSSSVPGDPRASKVTGAKVRDGDPKRAAARAAATQARILWKAVEGTVTTRNVFVQARAPINIAGAVAARHAGVYYVSEAEYSLDGQDIKIVAKVQRKPFAKKSGSSAAASKGDHQLPDPASVGGGDGKSMSNISYNDGPGSDPRWLQDSVVGASVSSKVVSLGEAVAEGERTALLSKWYKK